MNVIMKHNQLVNYVLNNEDEAESIKSWYDLQNNRTTNKPTLNQIVGG